MVGYSLKENSAGNVLEKNTAVGNTLEGYTIKNSSGNMLTENTSIGIGADTEEVAIGFLIIIYAHDNILKRNTARNHRIGFSINFSIFPMIIPSSLSAIRLEGSSSKE